MNIFVTVKTKKQEDKVEKIDNNHYVVYTKALPMAGKANKAVLKILASYFHLRAWQIQLISGQSSRKKIINIQI